MISIAYYNAVSRILTFACMMLYEELLLQHIMYEQRKQREHMKHATIVCKAHSTL